VLALGLMVAVLGYLAVAGLPQSTPGGATTQVSGLSPAERHAVYRLALALLAVLLLTVLIVAVYVLNRIGRALSRPVATKSADAHVDAWSHYRLTKEEIERATAEEPDEGTKSPPPE
jgi:hypothetical protein